MTLDWQRRRVATFAKRSKVVNVGGDMLPPLSITKGRGVILQSEKYNKQIATDLRKYVIARRGQFAFDPMSLYYGAIGQVAPIEVGLVSPDYVVFDIDDTVDGSFLNYYLRWPDQISTYESVAETGNQFGKRRRVYWSVFEKLEVLLPSLKEQRAIAAILASMDDAIEATQAVINQLQMVKKTMMAELFARGLPGNHARFKETDIGKVPAEWIVAQVAAVGAVDAGKARDPRGTGEPRPYLRVANVFDGEIRVHDVLEMPFTEREFQRFQVRDGDVLLNEGQSLELVGRCSMYRGELGRPCAMQNALLRFRAGKDVLPEFAEQYFRWCQASGRFAEIATQTTSIAHLGLRRFADMNMAVPGLAEQRKIAEMLASIDAQYRAEVQFRSGLVGTRSALLDVLMKGEIRISSDESAA